MNTEGAKGVSPVEVSDTLNLTRRLIARHPARIAGTRGSLEAARDVAAAVREVCDGVAEEFFTLHPGSLWNVGRGVAVGYLLSALLLVLWHPLVYASLLACLLGLLYGVVHYVFFGALFDFAFPAARGCNVVGTLEPAGDVRGQIILVGHHDSPYCLSFLMAHQKWASIRFLAAILFYLYLTVLCLATAFRDLVGFDWGLPNALTTVIAWIGFLFVGQLYFLITRIPSPGAGDNLNSCSMAIRIAGHFAALRKRGGGLKHTRLVVLSTDGEEAGERGSAAFVETHRDDLSGVPTTAVILESIFRLEDLAFLTRDRNCTLSLSDGLAHELHGSAARLGYEVPEAVLPFGGGGTDAIPFARAGVETTTLLGLSTALLKEGLYYHTPQDTVDHIDPRAVEAVMNIMVGYAGEKDARCGTESAGGRP